MTTSETPNTRFLLEGTVRDESGAPVAAGLAVEVFDLRVGGEHRVGAADVGADGAYAVTIDPEASRAGPGASLDLVVGVVRPGVGSAEPTPLVRSTPRFDAGPHEVIDVVVPAGGVPAVDEYSRVVAGVARLLAPEVAGPAAPGLAELVEDDERRDVTFLAAKGGLDARQVAMASLAEREAASTGIAAPLQYTLYRAGLPAGERLWALAPPATLATLWGRAVEAGIVAPEVADAIPDGLARAEELAGQAILDLPTGVADARFADLLDVSVPGDDERRAFLRAYRDHRDDPAALWSRLGDELAPGMVERLRLDGALAALTRNNIGLIGKLHDGPAPRRVGDLATAGFHRPERWRAALTDDVPVPDDVPGADDKTRRDTYATLLAEELRLRHPTAVVGAEVADGTIPVGGPDGTRDAVASFIAEHHDSWELAAHPVGDYIDANRLTVEGDARAELEALQRLAAVAPSPEALRGLAGAGLGSARAIAAHGEARFVERFAGELGGDAPAREVFRRSDQVHHATLAMATSHLVARAAPDVFAVPAGGPPAVDGPGRRALDALGAEATPGDVRTLPTLETLFRSVDSGACESCRSVLSPAAYLVDLLEFVDVEGVPAGHRNPQEVLFERRPDLQHMALSCENTEVELPYVDLVNEVLEYVVVHRSTEGYRGHDVAEGTRSVDLLASPQFVDDAAYEELRKATYPLALPWDQRLAGLRAHLAAAATSLHAAMTALGADDAGGRPWQQVLAERVAVGPAERDVLCGATVSAQALYGDDPARVSEAQLLAGVGNARRLSRRLGLTPTELVTLLRTRFVNPDTSELADLLTRLRVSLATIHALKAGTITAAQFRAALPAGLDPAPYGGDIVAWVTARHDRIMNMVVLVDPSGAEPGLGDSTGGFSALELRRALPDMTRNRLRAVDLLALARFVRLRARLGWSIERTDAALDALWPNDLRPGLSASDEARRRLDAGFAAAVTSLGNLLVSADLLGVDIDDELPWLLGCFGTLGVDGPDAPYRRLFLTPGLLGTDPAFGLGPDGHPPATAGARLLDHGPALRAALKLTDDDLSAVARAAAFEASTPMSLGSISTVFRFGYLARLLKVTAADLVALIEVSGLQPFGTLNRRDPDFVAFVSLVSNLRSLGLPVARVVSLARGPGELSDRPGDATGALLRAVRATVVGIEAPSSAGWTDAALRALLTAVYPPDAADTFLGLLAGVSTYATDYHQDAPDLPDAVRRAAPGLAYDPTRSQLLHRGVLPSDVAASVSALAGLPSGLAEAVSRLANAGQAEYRPFLTAYPLLAERWRAWAATPPTPEDPTGEARRSQLGAALLSAHQLAMRRRQLVDAVASATGAEPADVAALIGDPVALSGSSPDRPLAEDLLAATTRGFTARFWANATATPAAPPVRSATATAVDYGPGATALRDAAGVPDGPLSGAWASLVDPQASGAYTLVVDTDASAVTLRVGGTEVALDRSGATWATRAPVGLSAGAPIAVELTASGLDERITLRWRAEGLAQVIVPGDACCPAAAVATFSVAHQRLRTALELGAAVGLSVRELLVLARAPEHRVGPVSWLTALPAGAPPAAGDVPRLVRALASLADYRALRDRWNVTGTAIADALDGAGPDTPAAVIAAVAGVDRGTVDASLSHLAAPAGRPPTLGLLRRLADLLDLASTVGLPVPALARAIRASPSTEDVRSVRDARRSRYDEDSWAAVVRPVNDELRRAARDALVGRVLHLEHPDPDLATDLVTGGFTSPDQLYEHLLVDVQMDPCTTTSRVAQAIATAQLFVARCLLNLEPDVAPSSIDAARWEAMKRYRVWEANRRVFLFPENWLDPELRDDKSPFFRDVESELLQSDITDQAAATALGHYLEKLDEVANLEIAGLHVDERVAAGTTVPDPIVHVVGRTSGAKRSYFHRRLDGTWMPWERVNVDVPDDPVLPVIWKGRFLLFWLTVSKQPDARQPGPFAATAPAFARLGDLTVGDLALRANATLTVSLFWSEYYNGRWQSPRTSDPDRPIDLGAQFDVVGDPHLLRLASEVEDDGLGVRDSLGIIVLNPALGGTGNSWFRLYTTHSLPVRKQDDSGSSLGVPADRQFSTQGPFVITYSDETLHPRTVLRADRSPYRGVGPMHGLEDPHRAPFFFHDSRHVFYVHPDPTDPPSPPAFGLFPEPIAAPVTFPDPAELPEPALPG